MEVKLTKNWAGYKKSETIEVTDENVIKKGFEIGLFEKVKIKETKPKK